MQLNFRKKTEIVEFLMPVHFFWFAYCMWTQDIFSVKAYKALHFYDNNFWAVILLMLGFMQLAGTWLHLWKATRNLYFCRLAAILLSFSFWGAWSIGIWKADTKSFAQPIWTLLAIKAMWVFWRHCDSNRVNTK